MKFSVILRKLNIYNIPKIIPHSQTTFSENMQKAKQVASSRLPRSTRANGESALYVDIEVVPCGRLLSLNGWTADQVQEAIIRM